MSHQNMSTTTSEETSGKSNGSSNPGHNSHAVRKRLQSELLALMNFRNGGPKDGSSSAPLISAFPDGDNIFRWIGTIQGPSDSVFSPYKYKLLLEFPSDYPYVAPKVRFTSRCFHPNVDEHGNICLDILKNMWSALFDVKGLLLAIQSLLAEPNIESPLDLKAAHMWKDQDKYRKYLADVIHKND